VLFYVIGFVIVLIAVPVVIAFSFNKNKGPIKQKELR
jgi:hypothetical protein